MEEMGEMGEMGEMEEIGKGIFANCCPLFPLPFLPTPYSLLPTPYSLLPTPYSLLPTPYSLLPTPYSLLPTPSKDYCPTLFLSIFFGVRNTVNFQTAIVEEGNNTTFVGQVNVLVESNF